MSRKPKYENPQAVVDSFFQSVSDAYNSPGEGEQGRDGHKKLELLAEEFNISRIKARKISRIIPCLRYMISMTLRVHAIWKMSGRSSTARSNAILRSRRMG